MYCKKCFKKSGGEKVNMTPDIVDLCYVCTVCKNKMDWATKEEKEGE